MTDDTEKPDTLLERARQTIADGVGCDRWCDNGDLCGCRADGEAVIAMALEAVEKAVRTTLEEHGDPLATERAMRAIRGVIEDPSGTTG